MQVDNQLQMTFRRLFPVLICLCALLVGGATVAAAKSTTFVLRGAGFGHGIGMSQYGAYGQARDGRNYKTILRTYYTGTTIEKSSKDTIRVILRLGPSSLTFNGGTTVGDVELTSSRRYRVRRNGGRVQLLSGSNVIASSSSKLVVKGKAIKLNGTAINGLSNGRYRESIEFSPSDLGGLAAVNALDLDSYVQGVVPGEIPSSWHEEALKAQSVAARSYALTTDAGGALFDQWPDTRSQVYKGIAVETTRTNRAVQDTAGLVVKSGGRVATTYFFSTSGGQTENIDKIWNSKSVAYLKSVKDPWDKLSPYHRWTVRFSRAQLQSKLRPWVRGQLRDVRVVERGVSPRVVRARVIGTRGSKTIKGTELRTRLGLRDTWVSFKRVTR